jgi:pimeloyl-ACP methyl ester carboxylesterase
VKRLAGGLVIVVVVLAGALAALYTPDLPLDELKAHWAPAPSKFVAVQGLDVHYRDEGTGPAVLLLHGTGASLHTWDAWSETLRDGHRVVRLDLPGFGLTGPPADGDFGIPRIVAFIDEFANKIGLDRFAVAGNSWGGEIAWTYALDHRQRVTSLILVDAGGFPLAHEVPLVFRMARHRTLFRLMAKLGTRSFVDKTLRDVYGDESRITDELRRRYLELSCREGNRVSFSDRILAPHVDRTAELKNLTVPTLIFWGGRDRVVPVANAERFHAAIPKSRVIVHDDAGHVPMEELGAATAAEAADFLR